jgi:hypothetical protein
MAKYTDNIGINDDALINQGKAAAAQSVLAPDPTSAPATTQPGIIAGAQGAAANAPAPTGIIASAQAAASTTPAAAPAHDYSGDLSSLYQQDLSRAPDAAGLSYWEGRMNNGATADQVDQEIKNSDEYKKLHAAPAPAAPTAATLGAPTQWQVGANQTVAGQMKNLIDPNNPYYQQWATAGAQDAAARGFTGNSSIRDTGILDSVMRGATPIATSDASTYAKAAGYNADMSNQFAMKNADLQQQMAIANLSANTQKYLGGLSADTQKTVAQMSNASQQAISQAHDANSVLIQSNQAAAQAYQNYVNAVGTIDIQPGMDEHAKSTAIATQTAIFNQAIAGLKANNPGTADISIPLEEIRAKAVAQVGGVDVSSYLRPEFFGLI